MLSEKQDKALVRYAQVKPLEKLAIQARDNLKEIQSRLNTLSASMPGWKDGIHYLDPDDRDRLNDAAHLAGLVERFISEHSQTEYQRVKQDY